MAHSRPNVIAAAFVLLALLLPDGTEASRDLLKKKPNPKVRLRPLINTCSCAARQRCRSQHVASACSGGRFASSILRICRLEADLAACLQRDHSTEGMRCVAAAQATVQAASSKAPLRTAGPGRPYNIAHRGSSGKFIDRTAGDSASNTVSLNYIFRVNGHSVPHRILTSTLT